jgi:NADH-quinone oxidoreductase subunit E
MTGRRTLYLCDGRCGLASCEALARHAMKVLGVAFGSTTANGRFRLATLRCRENAAYGSIAMIDEDRFVIAHPSELDALLGPVAA